MPRIQVMHGSTPVFTYDVGSGTDAGILRVLWFDFTIGGGSLADIYHKTTLRPLREGDVITIDGRAYRLTSDGQWSALEGTSHAQG